MDAETTVRQSIFIINLATTEKILAICCDNEHDPILPDHFIAIQGCIQFHLILHPRTTTTLHQQTQALLRSSYSFVIQESLQVAGGGGSNTDHGMWENSGRRRGELLKKREPFGLLRGLLTHTEKFEKIHSKIIVVYVNRCSHLS